MPAAAVTAVVSIEYEHPLGVKPLWNFKPRMLWVQMESEFGAEDLLFAAIRNFSLFEPVQSITFLDDHGLSLSLSA